MYHDLKTAQNLEFDGLPWHIRLENRITRHAFWEAWGGGDGIANINWGRIGSAGRTVPVQKPVSDVFEVVWKKLQGEYRYVKNKAQPKNPGKTFIGPFSENTQVIIEGEFGVAYAGNPGKTLIGPFSEITRVIMEGEFGVAYAGNRRLMKLPKKTVHQLHKDSKGSIIIEIPM